MKVATSNEPRVTIVLILMRPDKYLRLFVAFICHHLNTFLAVYSTSPFLSGLAGVKRRRKVF